MTITLIAAAEPKKNSTKDLINFFSVPGNTVSVPEFSTFWKSCTEEQKEYYRTADLGLPTKFLA